MRTRDTWAWGKSKGTGEEEEKEILHYEIRMRSHPAYGEHLLKRQRLREPRVSEGQIFSICIGPLGHVSYTDVFTIESL